MALLILSLTACVTRQPHTVYEDKYIPIPLVPMPPDVKVPEYYAKTLTEEQKNDIGELTKAYVISSQESMNYIRNLEKVHLDLPGRV